MSVNIHTEGNLDSTLRSPVNHVSFDQNFIIHEQEEWNKICYAIHCVVQNFQSTDTANASFIWHMLPE